MKYDIDIKIFIRTVFLFLSPVAALLAIAVFFSVYAGEIMPLRRVVENQSRAGQEYLFERAVLARETVKYKFTSVVLRRPDILAAGSSRVLQLRKEMFNPKDNFYNAGSLVVYLRDLEDFINQLPEDYAPKAMIVGLDLWWFDSANIEKNQLVNELAKKEELYNWKAYLYATRHVLWQLVKNPKFVLTVMNGVEPFAGSRAIGLGALEHGEGFRNDGSRQYAAYTAAMRESPAYHDRESSPVVERIKEGADPFSFTSAFDPAGLAILDRLLAASERRGIKVIGVAPPFSSEAYQLMTHSYYAPFVKEFARRVPPVFARHGFAYFDFSDPQSGGMDDVYMFDGFHQTETGMAKLMVAVLKEACRRDIFRDCLPLRQRLQKILEDPLTTPAEMHFDTF